jgi:hypothetical protein
MDQRSHLSDGVDILGRAHLGSSRIAEEKSRGAAAQEDQAVDEGSELDNSAT